MPTIFAEATPPGRGGISVVRVSGPRAFEVAEVLAAPLPALRQLALRRIADAGGLIDEGCVLCFEAGASFTGEPVVEFHLHGAPVVVRRLEAALAAQGLRRAEAGEFTRRALRSGRLDLTEVEGLGDLLAAESESQRVQALATLSGRLKGRAEGWRAELLRAGAMLTAAIDFPDEDALDAVPPQVWLGLEAARRDMAEALEGFMPAERIRRGFTVALVGPPNAGKSSLMNAIARREVSIVTPIAGTTRDVIEAQLELGGLAVTLLDTAGLREASDAVERIGVARTLERAEAADLRVHLSEDGQAVDAALLRDGDIVVASKTDLTGVEGVSALTGEGVDRLLADITRRLTDRAAGAGPVTHLRQAEALSRGIAALEGIQHQSAEIAAERLRVAEAALQSLLGTVGVEDYLDIVFSTFCIGK